MITRRRTPSVIVRCAITVLAGSALVSGCTTTMDRSELATEYYNLGTAFFDLGDLTRSADYLSRALELDESLARASYNLARVYALQGRFVEAEELLQSLKALEPENTMVLKTLGYVAYSRGDLDAAAVAYDDVLRIDPGSVNAFYNRAIIADESNEPERAAELLRSARAIDDGDAGVLDLLASVEERLGNAESAISALEDLKALGSTNSDALLRLAALYEVAERYDRALEELEGVIVAGESLESQAEALFRKGRILLTAAQEPEAGLEALRSSFASGFADAERIEQLRDDPALVASGEVRELLAESGLLPDASSSDEIEDDGGAPDDTSEKPGGE